MSTKIIPAILPANFAEVVEKTGLIKGLVKNVQIDICDGHFVPSFTWPYKKRDDNYELLLREENGLPNWESLNYEFDLMVNNPETVVDDWVLAGANRIILHAECKGDLAGAFKLLQRRVEMGLALNMDTPIDVVSNYEGVTIVQLMGIDVIGMQGQTFDDKVLARIKEVREKFPQMLIAVDGGVNLETAPSLIEAGADHLIVGSAIFANENPGEVIRKLQAF